MFQSFIVGEVEHLFEEVDPEDGLHRPVGTAVVHAVHGSKALLVNQGERLVSENLGPTSLQALSLLRRHQELGLPEALLRVSYSEHPPLPRPGAAPTTFYYIIPTLPQAGEGFLRTNQNMDDVQRIQVAQKLTQGGLFPPTGVNIVRWDATPDLWGTLVLEADSEADVFRAIGLWRAAGAGFFKVTKTAPVLPVQEAIPIMAAIHEAVGG